MTTDLPERQISRTTLFCADCGAKASLVATIPTSPTGSTCDHPRRHAMAEARLRMTVRLGDGRRTF